MTTTLEPNATVEELEASVASARSQLLNESNEKVAAAKRRYIANTEEKIAVLRYKEARAVKQAAYEAEGYSPSEARRIAERIDPERPNIDSTEARLAYQASRGDEDAAAKLRNKQRLRGRGEFYSRTVPAYTGPVTDIPEGASAVVKFSPLTGRAVLIRPGAQAKEYSEARAQSVWERNYTVTARVHEDLYQPRQPELQAAAPVERKYPLASATVPVTIVPERPPDNFQGTGQPEGTGTTINVPRYFITPEQYQSEHQVQEFKRPALSDLWETPDQAIGFGELREGEAVARAKDLDLLGASSSAFQAFSYKFAGGTARTVKSFYTHPAESSFVLGTYVAAGAVAGPPGVAGLFAAQNVYESSKGEKPTVVRAFEDPVTFAGEMAPFIAFEGVRAGRAKTKAAAATEQVAGTVAGPQTVETIAGVPSAELRVQPLEAVRDTIQRTESLGSERILAVREPVKGEDVFLTAKELESQPAAWLTKTELSVVQRTKPAGGSVEGISTPAATARADLTAIGRTNAQTLGRIGEDRVIVAEAQETGLSPYLERKTLLKAETRFSGYEMPATSELTTTPGEAATKGPWATSEAVKQFGRVGIEKKGGMVGYEPKLDFFEEFFITDRNMKALIRESPYTGAREVTYETTPYIVTEVRSPGRVPASAPNTPETTGPSSGEVEVSIEVPQSDGTVKLQKVSVIELEPSKQETTTIAEQRQKSVLREQKTKEQLIQEMTPDQRFKYIPQSATGKPYAEAIVKFRGLKRVGGFPALRGYTVTSQTSGVAAAASTSAAATQAITPSQDVGTMTVQLPAQDAAQRAAQETATRTASLTDSLTSPASLTTSRTRAPPEELRNPPPVPRFTRTSNRKQLFPSFGVAVRRRGRFETVGKGLPFEDAVKKGAGIVGATAAASFKLEPEGEPSRRSPLDLLPRKQFRASKREPGVIIERSRFRISTPGEVGEISRKGQAASKRRRKKKGGGFTWGF